MTSETQCAVHIEEDELLQWAISKRGRDHSLDVESEECVQMRAKVR